jgi:hypothetical protein
MKRHIKFRVWNIPQKQCKPVEGSVIHIDDETNTSTLKPMDEDHGVQQSLNLYDIDGKEIFEGDIVDLYAKKQSSYKPKAIHQASVRWIEAYACFGLYQYKNGEEIPIYKVDTKKLRVLGNVLEGTPKA